MTRALRPAQEREAAHSAAAAAAAAAAARARAEREEMAWLGQDGWGLYSSWLETLLSACYIALVLGLIRLGGMRVVDYLEVMRLGFRAPAVVCSGGCRPCLCMTARPAASAGLPGAARKLL